MTDSSACHEFDSDALEIEYQTRLPGDETAIGPVVERIMDLVATAGCADGDEFEIELALTEAIANAVRHGCEGDPNKSVTVSIACQVDRGLLIVVSDPGEGFDPHDVPNPIEAENLYSTHGRGIFLINRVMDHVEYKRGGATIRMRKRPRGVELR